jgi:hypothetical protein
MGIIARLGGSVKVRAKREKFKQDEQDRPDLKFWPPRRVALPLDFPRQSNVHPDLNLARPFILREFNRSI